ncbi:MAG: DUF554 domain-containing protein, partial [Actinobacteria bacterium]|nr:DUF554 domain-containing protein [Actinomycetota bacterium]
LVGERLPERFRQTVMQAIGLMTLLIGFQMALGTKSAIIVLGSVVMGAVVGEALRIDDGLTAFGNWVERTVYRATGRRGEWETGRVGMRGAVGAGGSAGPLDDPQNPESRTQTPSHTQSSALTPQSSVDGALPAAGGAEDVERGGSLFSKGFVTASLIFCVGPMTILGSFQDGLTGVYSTLAVKSVLDGFTALALASSLGWGVVFSAGIVLLYQGALTMGATWAKPFLSASIINEMTAAGGLLIVGIGLNILGIVKIRVANMLPALIFAPILTAVFGG